MSFQNVYADSRRAEAYAQLQFPGTYYLAFRDLPAIIAKYVTGRSALDFGCGAGRSTRFLKQLGLETMGVDISANMIALAREQDPTGVYRLIADDGRITLPQDPFALVLSAFTFDNIPTAAKKISLLANLGNLLHPTGCILNLVSSPDIYTHEWLSFTTKDFPANQHARSGDTVQIIMTDVEDRRPVADILWTDESYREVYARAGLQLVETIRPLAVVDEPYDWVNETRVPPWVIYVLKKASRS
jgi:SAM-dependent methyltransferase